MMMNQVPRDTAMHARPVVRVAGLGFTIPPASCGEIACSCPQIGAGEMKAAGQVGKVLDAID